MLVRAVNALTGPAPAAAGASPRRPIRLAMFDLELDDFSAGGPLAGESAAETARLQRVSALGRELLSRSGLCSRSWTSALPLIPWSRRIGCESATAATPTRRAISVPT